MISKYLNYLHEAGRSSNLPPDLIKALIEEIYPKRYTRKRPFTIKDIEQEDKDGYLWFEAYDDWDRKKIDYNDLDPGTRSMMEATKLCRTFITKQKLYGIFDYWNGDTAWFSFIDKKVYDFNHELGYFNAIVPDKSTKKYLTMSIGYKQWIKNVLDNTHEDAWKKKTLFKISPKRMSFIKSVKSKLKR